MTKKHFIEIARRIRMLTDTGKVDLFTSITAMDLAEDLADYFAELNPQFDRAKFLTACGIMPVKRKDNQ